MDLIGARQTAEILGVSRATVLRMARRGELAAVKVGNSYAFQRDDVTIWALDHTDEAHPQTTALEGAEVSPSSAVTTPGGHAAPDSNPVQSDSDRVPAGTIPAQRQAGE